MRRSQQTVLEYIAETQRGCVATVQWEALEDARVIIADYQNAAKSVYDAWIRDDHNTLRHAIGDLAQTTGKAGLTLKVAVPRGWASV